MKPSNFSPPRPGLACQVVRLWSALRNDGGPTPRHFQTCEACRQFVVSNDQLQAGLTQAARQSATTPSPGMERRIMEAVRYSPAPRPEPSSRRFLSIAVAGGAAAMVGVGLWHFHLAPFSPQTPTTTAEYSAEVAALVAAVRSLPDNLNQTLAVPSVQLAQDNSLNREVENVYSDARSALDFLALNFLPVSDANETASRLLDQSPQRI